ncbi:hypothetical protein [Nocardia thailandica]
MTSDDAGKKDEAAADKPDLAKAEAPDEKTAKTPEPKAEAAATETAKTEAAKAEPAKTEPAKTEAAKAVPAAPKGKLPTAWLAAGAAGVVAVAAVTTAVVFYLQSSDKGEKLDAISESTAAACAYGKIVANYDYSKNLDQYIESMKAGATGDYLEQFTTASDALKSLMIEQQVRSRGEEVQCGYITGTTEEAKAMVTFAQYRTNVTGSDQTPINLAVEMTLERHGDKWLVSKLDSPLLKSGGAGGAAVPGAGGAGTPGTSAPAPAPSQAPAPR